MFVPFFFHLRQRGIPTSPTEFLTLLEALDKGLAAADLTRFYTLSRAILVKKEEHFDRFDMAFAEFFQDRPFAGTNENAELTEELLSWLEEAKFFRELSKEQIEALEKLDLDELRRLFQERLDEQKERHDGGNRWIGTGGTSPFGHSGYHPSGIRVGGTGGGRSAVQIATARRFRNLRSDLVLDTRQISLALRKLRQLTRQGRADELDLEATIDQTAKNFGDIELVFRPPRENQVKLLFLADVGGSMTPHSELTSRLFSAAHKASHFKRFEAYYFHNCFYETLYTDMAHQKGVPTAEVLDKVDDTWRCFVVGDAAMAPTELLQPGGSIDYYHFNPEPGITWINRLKERVPKTAWLNPDPVQWWGSYTTRVIQTVFEMFPLTLEGLDDAVAYLR